MKSALQLQEKAGSVIVSVWVKPRAGSERVIGVREGRLELAVTAIPEGGKANAAVCRLLASELGVGRTQVVVVKGHTGRYKQVEIRGVSRTDLAARLGLS